MCRALSIVVLQLAYILTRSSPPHRNADRQDYSVKFEDSGNAPVRIICGYVVRLFQGQKDLEMRLSPRPQSNARVLLHSPGGAHRGRMQFIVVGAV